MGFGTLRFKYRKLNCSVNNRYVVNRSSLVHYQHPDKSAVGYRMFLQYLVLQPDSKALKKLRC